MTAPRREILLKTVRGNNFRRALKAIAELRATDHPALAEIVGAYHRLAALDTLRAWMTPARRTRATGGLVEMLEQHRQAPYVVLAQIVETLGHTATKHDAKAVQALEALGPQSGAPYRVTYEELDESNLDWRERLLAESKGIDPARIKVRMGHHPTGLLDRKVLAAALERIQARG
jgi:hypothetical protein